MGRWFIGDVLTGRRIQTLPVLSGSWTEVINDVGDISCTVTLRDPDVARLGLAQSAAVGKAYLAYADGQFVAQAGPIWKHSFSRDGEQLTLSAQGMLSYTDHMQLLPNTTTSPADSSTDTNVTSSLQGIVRYYLEQMMSWDHADVPIVLPAEIPGTNVRNELGASLSNLKSKLLDLTQVEGGPDLLLPPRYQTDSQGVEWVARIGTPDQPQLFSPQDVVFNVGLPESSVSGLQVTVDGSKLASIGFASAGKQDDVVLISEVRDSTLTDAGYPLLMAVDSSHSTVSDMSTLDAYAAALVVNGRVPVTSIEFDHDLSLRPSLSSFSVGDFAQVKIHDDPYLGSATYRMRITSRSGDAVGKKLHIKLQPEVV